MLPQLILKLLHSTFLLYCGHSSFLAIQSPQHDDDTRWLTFWLFYTIYEFTVVLLDYTVGYVVPLYEELKLCFVIFLGVGGGSGLLYPLIKPFLLHEEEMLEAQLTKAKKMVKARTGVEVDDLVAQALAKRNTVIGNLAARSE